MAADGNSLMINTLIGLMVRRSGQVTIGANSRVRWWGLRHCAMNRVRIGSDSIVRCRIDFDSAAGAVSIGNRCFLGSSHLVCHSEIAIGDDVIVSWGVTIVDHDSHPLNWDDRQNDVGDWIRHHKDWGRVSIAPVFVGNRVWIGFGASILKGVRVGEGAVVGARAVVTKDVPRYSVVVGNPARVVRQLAERES
jgi:acetyltransferase-like isoleucine patch superfamily enzyme